MNELMCIVERALDEDVATVLGTNAGFTSPIIHVKRGRAKIAERVRGYYRASQRAPWFVLVDLDHDPCPGELLKRWNVPSSGPSFVCRVAVREIEAWLLADRVGFARFLRVSPDLIPRGPEAILDPKRFVVELAGRSSSRDIREDLQPSSHGRRREGPAYSSRLSQFVRSHWRPEDARANAASLNSCMKRLAEMRRSLSPLVVGPRTGVTLFAKVQA